MVPTMKIVVTGGAGFIGSMLVPMLLKAGHHVHVIDNLMFGGQALLPLFINPNFSFAEVDVTNREALAPQLQDADAIIHLAALVGYPLCKKMPMQARVVNVDGARNVIELAPPGTRLQRICRNIDCTRLGSGATLNRNSRLCFECVCSKFRTVQTPRPQT